jgi:hypothetical protein
VPPSGQQNRGKRRMRVGSRRLRNQRPGSKEVPRRWTIVAGLIPVIGQPKQSQMREIDRRKEHWVEQSIPHRPSISHAVACSAGALAVAAYKKIAAGIGRPHPGVARKLPALSLRYTPWLSDSCAFTALADFISSTALLRLARSSINDFASLYRRFTSPFRIAFQTTRPACFGRKKYSS